MTFMELKKYHGRCFVRLTSGQDVDLLNPDPDTILIQDIASHLSRIQRYNGILAKCSDQPMGLSVGIHSLMVAKLLPGSLKLQGLLHDATEAYMGDLVGPLKDIIPEFKEIENNLMLAIMQKFDLGFPLHPLVKEMDKRCLAAEMEHCLGWVDLASQISGVRLEGFKYPNLTPVQAERAFLGAFEEYSQLARQ